MHRRIEKVAVLGAGTMGARISAHLANAGVPSYLLDIVPPDADGPMRNRIASAGLEAAVKSKPAAFFEPSLAKLVTLGNFEDDLEKLAEVDWILEAVVEDLEIKRNLLRRINVVRKPGTIVTTNTSGLPVARIVTDFPEEFRRNWFGTHFFNPPRYMRLLELIPTPDADAGAMETIAHFCDLRLGKGVVRAKDTPNFIANRIGTFSALNVMRLMQEMDLTVEEVDALTGTAVGWPKMATFRLTDMVGLDVLGHVVRNASANIHDERSDLTLPDFFTAMLERKWLGDKTRGGFYKKQKSAEGEQRLALDWKTLEYRPQQRPKFPSLEMANSVESLPERLHTLLAPSRDRANIFLWSVLSDLWTYAANRIGEIADSAVEIDRAMKLGFNWDMGPFELWDAAGVAKTVQRMQVEGKPVSPTVEKLLASGEAGWYADDPKAVSGRVYFDLRSS
ncbi:MAG TPA: 3-hydroxyacyl-CoA dehydrogenase NAD-binding domain-containing protein, partial [Terracidiphilus sp.]